MSIAERFVESYAEGWREGPDASVFDKLYHSDGRLLDAGVGRIVERNEMPAYLRRIQSVLPDFRLEVKDWSSRGSTVFIEFVAKGTLGGEPIEWEGVDRFTLRGDKATERVAYFDSLPLWERIDPSMKRGHLLDVATSVPSGGLA